MATLQDSYNLWHRSRDGGSDGAKSVKYRTQAATQAASVAVLSESPTTADRQAWARTVINSPVSASEPIWTAVTANATIVDKYAADETGATITDGDIQFVVNSVVSAAYPLV